MLARSTRERRAKSLVRRGCDLAHGHRRPRHALTPAPARGFITLHHARLRPYRKPDNALPDYPACCTENTDARHDA
jgi:hypothetical protein